MKTLSNSDFATILRVLRWAAVQGDGTTRDCEWRRKANNLRKKLERKSHENHEKEQH